MHTYIFLNTKQCSFWLAWYSLESFLFSLKASEHCAFFEQFIRFASTLLMLLVSTSQTASHCRFCLGGMLLLLDQRNLSFQKPSSRQKCRSLHWHSFRSVHLVLWSNTLEMQSKKNIQSSVSKTNSGGETDGAYPRPIFTPFLPSFSSFFWMNFVNQVCKSLRLVLNCDAEVYRCLGYFTFLIAEELKLTGYSSAYVMFAVPQAF